MSERCFLDTNLLVYADDADAGDKQGRAQALIAEAFASQTGVISTQVLQEYFVVATRKLALPAAAVQRRVELYAQLSVVSIDVGHVIAAIKLHRLNAISFWDALILRAAQLAGCARLYSEDLQHGQQLEGVAILNPFAPNAPSPAI